MKLPLLLSKGFVTGLLVLIINDHLLKGYYGNWVTGKLSDFAGLFVFPIFLTALFPKAIRFNHVFTFVFFIFWKTELSEPFFDWANATGISIGRVADYTDFIALVSIPVSYFYINKIQPGETPFVLPSRFAVVLVGCIAMVSFMATSRARRFSGEEFTINETYKSRLTKHAFLDSVRTIHLHVSIDTAHLQAAAGDTIYTAEDFSEAAEGNEMEVKNVSFSLQERKKGCYINVKQVRLKHRVEMTLDTDRSVRKKAKDLAKKFLIDPLD